MTEAEKQQRLYAARMASEQSYDEEQCADELERLARRARERAVHLREEALKLREMVEAAERPAKTVR